MWKCPNCQMYIKYLISFGFCTYHVYVDSKSGEEFTDQFERTGLHAKATCPQCDHEAEIDEFTKIPEEA